LFGDQWYNWVGEHVADQAQLEVALPHMPNPHKPKYNAWKKSLEELDVDEETVLIGHGLGASFLTRWLSERKRRNVSPEQLILVGPWHRHRQQRVGAEFLYYDIDRNLAKRVGRISLLTSADSSVNLLISANHLYKKLGADVDHYSLDGFGNFIVGNAMEDESFPELLEVVNYPNGQ
jgi:predicted alpha/beta hydrolase family esterase